jgi:hypothetical protein
MGVRASNLLIAAYIEKRDFDTAYDVMNYMNFEEDFVRNRGVRVFEDEPDEKIFQSHQNEIILRERLEIERQTVVSPRGTNQIDQRYYDKFGNCYDDIYQYRRMKYDVATVGKLNQSEILMNRAEIHQEIIHKNYLADQETKRLTMTDQYKSFMKRNKEHLMPEFGSNIHTFAPLILSPFLNIDSRNYYDRDKHVSLLLYTVCFDSLSFTLISSFSAHLILSLLYIYILFSISSLSLPTLP